MSGEQPTDTQGIALALVELKGSVAEGFATVNGHLALLTQRTDQTDRQLNDHEKRLDALERGETERQRKDASRLDTLERGRWPLPSVAALAGIGGLALSAYQLLGK